MISERSSLSRILVIAEGQIGDLLLLTPIFRAIKETFPSASLSLLAVERRPTVDGHQSLIAKSERHFLNTDPHLSAIFVLRRDLLRALPGIARLRAEWTALQFLRKQHFDMIVSAFPDDRFAIWSWLLGAKVRIGEAHKGLRLAYTRSPVMKKGEGSILSYFCELAELAGCHVTSRQTAYTPSDACEKWAEQFVVTARLATGRFIIVHPGATGDYKIWPPERFREMILRLVQRSGYPVVVCGGPREKQLVDSITDGVRSFLVQVHIETEVGRFASLAKRAALVISNDSGPRHIAVAVRTPSLAVFRRFHDREWGVYPESDSVRTVQSHDPCPLCRQGVCEDRIPAGFHYGSACLHAVSVSEVISRALTLLRRTTSAE